MPYLVLRISRQSHLVFSSDYHSIHRNFQATRHAVLAAFVRFRGGAADARRPTFMQSAPRLGKARSRLFFGDSANVGATHVCAGRIGGAVEKRAVGASGAPEGSEAVTGAADEVLTDGRPTQGIDAEGRLYYG